MHPSKEKKYSVWDSHTCERWEHDPSSEEREIHCPDYVQLIELIQWLTMSSCYLSHEVYRPLHGGAVIHNNRYVPPVHYFVVMSQEFSDTVMSRSTNMYEALKNGRDRYWKQEREHREMMDKVNAECRKHEESFHKG